MMMFVMMMILMRSREKERVLLLCALKWIKRVAFSTTKVT
jgi:hypothetical protein